MAGTIATLAAGAAAWALSMFDVQMPFGLQRSNVTAVLGPLLSAGASIYFPGSDGFDNATDRWQTWKAPTLEVVVQVASEQDVEQTIKYANKHHKQFLAISGGHGTISDLGKVQNGIGVWLSKMKTVEIADDGRTATVGGGITSGEFLHTLWAHGKQAVTGSCECTGVVPPMLGGGHGWLQGRHGLMADNLVSASLTLANGTTIRVSENERADLFWGLRGAGHNFGIVTEFEYRIHDHTAENENWAYETMFFGQDKLEEVFEVANAMIGGSVGTQPVELVHWAYFGRLPQVDPVEVRPCPLIASLLRKMETDTLPACHDVLPHVPRLIDTVKVLRATTSARPFQYSSRCH